MESMQIVIHCSLSGGISCRGTRLVYDRHLWQEIPLRKRFSGEMRTILKEVRRGDGIDLEFKYDIPSDKHKLLKTACAFVTGNGRRIIIGVDDDGTIVCVDGIVGSKNGTVQEDDNNLSKS